MKKLFTVLIAAALGLTSTAANAQCSGQIDITYPSGSGTATSSYNNGSPTPSATYCPTNTAAQSLVVTPASSGTLTLQRTMNGTTTTLQTQTSTGGSTYTFTLPSVTTQAVYSLASIISCNNSKSITVTLTLAPTLTLATTAYFVCSGSTATLTATGATAGGSYTFSAPGMTPVTNTTGVLTVTPTQTTTYTVTAPTSCGTNTTQQLTVTVPTVTITPAAPTVFIGSPVTLTAVSSEAGATYDWRTGGKTGLVVGTGPTLTVSPLVTTTYTATATSTTTPSTCATSKDVTVTVSLTPLPVELASFAVTRTGSRALLTWATASERNSAYFAVERSATGGEFTALGKVAGAGQSAAYRAYSFSDLQPLSTAAYYRLRQVDLDGTTQYSPLAYLTAAPSSEWLEASATPRHYAVRAALAAGSRFAVLDLLGRPVFSQPLTPEQAEVTVPALPAGVYLFQLTTPQGRYTQRQVVDAAN